MFIGTFIVAFMWLLEILFCGDVMNNINFDEMDFFNRVKNQPALFLGKPSLLSLRDYIFGMQHAFLACGYKNELKYFNLFTKWYLDNSTDKNGYYCWWNHILYISGNDDEKAFYSFFDIFEQYLKQKHDIYLDERFIIVE